MTTTVEAAGLLRERAARLRGVYDDLVGPGPLEHPLRLARNHEIWKGRLRDAFVAYLEGMDRFLRNRVAGSVDLVVRWLENRASQLEDYQRGLATGAAPLPAGPLAPFGGVAPGNPGPYDVGHLSATGYTGLDPARVRELAGALGTAGNEIYGIGARIERIVYDLGSLVPSDAAEAAGKTSLAQLSRALQDAVRDLHKRARAIESADEASRHALKSGEKGKERLGDEARALPWAAEKMKKLKAGEEVFDTRGWIRALKHPLSEMRQDARHLLQADTAEETAKYGGKLFEKAFKGAEVLFKGKEEWERRKDLGPADRLLHASWAGVTEVLGAAQGGIWGAEAGTLGAELAVAAVGLTGPAGLAIVVGVGLVGAVIGSAAGQKVGSWAKSEGQRAGRLVAGGVTAGAKTVGRLGKLFGR